MAGTTAGAAVDWLLGAVSAEFDGSPVTVAEGALPQNGVQNDAVLIAENVNSADKTLVMAGGVLPEVERYSVSVEVLHYEGGNDFSRARQRCLAMCDRIAALVRADPGMGLNEGGTGPLLIEAQCSTPSWSNGWREVQNAQQATGPVVTASFVVACTGYRL